MKRRNESFQARAEEPLGTDSYQTISKRSTECWLPIEHKNASICIIVSNQQTACPEFFSCVLLHDGYCPAILVQFVHQRNAHSQETFSLI